jgi:hypothetical protein
MLTVECLLFTVHGWRLTVDGYGRRCIRADTLLFLAKDQGAVSAAMPQALCFAPTNGYW